MATWVDKIKAPLSGQVDTAAKAPSLRLRTFASGRHVWYIRARVRGGKPVLVVLGEYPGVTEEAAELAASVARNQLRQGINPNTARDAQVAANQRAGKTFGEVATEWTESRIAKGKWSAATIATRRAVFNGPKLRHLSARLIGTITTHELEELAEGIPANSQQGVLGPLRSVLLFAVSRGYLEKSPFVGITVRAAEGNSQPLVVFAEGKSPDFSELLAALAAFDEGERQFPDSPWWNIWRVAVLTGARPSALIGLRWDDLSGLDTDAPVWNLPAERSKIKRASSIPLSKAAASILRDVPRRGELVWPGRFEGNFRQYPARETAMVNALMGAHGFGHWAPGRARDTVASWLEMQNDATERAMALVLNHRVPADNTRRKHYARISAEHQARVLIERWASAVEGARRGDIPAVTILRAA